MNIKAKLLLSVLFLLCVIASIAYTIILSANKVTIATHKGELAHTLVHGIFNLTILTNEYLLYQTDRSKVQWEKTYQSIEKVLNDEHLLNGETTRENREKIRKELRNSKQLFQQLTISLQAHPTATASAFEKRLMGQLQIQAQSMLNGATHVLQTASDEEQSVREWSNQLVMILLLVIVTAILLTAYFWYRSVALPIVLLSSVMHQVRNGDLSRRARISSHDEIGSLAQTFNEMLDEIKESHDLLEEKVAERTKELQAANRDLESFSYSVSHDLRSPLRAIDGFSQILQEDYAKYVDDKGKEVIATIRKGAQYMAELIDDLLSFSRLGRQALTPQVVSMTPLVKEVYAELMQTTPQRNIRFTCANLPTMYADPSLLRHVWMNLIANALKYTKNKKEAVISIGSKDEGDTITYFITDNGAGFDMRYVNKLFGVFQRLHDQREFEGTGVGLAIVSRIITKHGGKVWAVGTVGQGATFYFSLPKQRGGELI